MICSKCGSTLVEEIGIPGGTIWQCQICDIPNSDWEWTKDDYIVPEILRHDKKPKERVAYDCDTNTWNNYRLGIKK